MNHLTNEKSSRPMLRATLLALLIPSACATAFAMPAVAEAAGPRETIRIAITDEALGDARSIAGIRRRIAIAAHTLCGSGGVASIYRDGARRCRERAVADAERQLERRIATRFERTESSPPSPPSIASMDQGLAGGASQAVAPLSLAALIGYAGLGLVFAHATR